MYNPIGYTAIINLEKEAKELQIMGFRPSDFLRALMKAPTVFADDQNGNTTEMPKDILTKWDKEFAFIDRATWKVTFDLMRETTRDLKFSKGQLSTAMIMLADGFSPPVPSWLPESLLKFEGSPLFLLSEDGKRVLADLEDEREVIERGAATNHETMDEVIAAYKKFVTTHLNPNNSTRKQWRKKNHLNGKNIPREIERELRRTYTPDSWKKAGRPPKN